MLTHRSIVCVIACHLLVTTAALAQEQSPVAYGATTLLDIEISRATLNTQLSYLNERRAGRSWSSSGAASASLGMLGPAFAAPQEEEASALTTSSQWLWGGYVKGYGLLSDIDSDDARIGIDDADTFGIQVGVDRLFGDHFLAGLMVGYSRSYGDFDDDLGDIDVDTWQIGGYASMDFDRWYVDVSLTYGGSDWDTQRNIPTLGRGADAAFDGWNLTTYVGGGYRFDLPNGWTLAPTLAFVYSYFDYDGFTESGAGAADLVVDDRDTDSFRSRLGARLVLADLASGPTWVPDVALGWEHEFEDPDDIDARFAVGGSPFSVGTGDFDGDAMYLGVGVSYLPRSNVTGSLRYEGLYGSDTSSHALIGGISLRF